MFTYTMFELIKLKMIAENIAIPLITALVGDLILVEIVMSGLVSIAEAIFKK